VTDSGRGVSFNGELSDQIRSLVDQADTSTVPSATLLWFGNTALPTGCDTEPRIVSSAEWAGQLLRLNGGTLPGAEQSLPPLVRVQRSAAQPGEPVPLAILWARFHRPTEATHDAVSAAAATGRRADLPDTLADAIEPAETLMATALLADQWQRPVPAFRGRTVTLTLPPELLLSNDPAGPISDIAVDAGEGWQPLGVGASITVVAPADAEQLHLTVRCSTPGGERQARCDLALSDDPIPPRPDEIWQLTRPGSNPGHAFVFRSGTGERLRRPILIAEGWPGGASAATLAEAVSQHDLLNRWRSSGHDVIMVGFDRGLDAIPSNTGVVRHAIETASQRTGDQLVVGGMSMGALVSRLALLEMEHEGLDHRTAAYLSIDGPHGRGAYTTVAGQWLVQQFRWLSPQYAGLAHLIHTPSNLQFISLIVSDDQVGPDPLRTAFLAELDRLGGYPTRPVKLAVACGQGTGQASPPPTDPILSWRVPGLIDVVLHPMPAGAEREIARAAIAGSPVAPPPALRVHSDVCWESVPGAVDVLNAEVTSILASFGCPIETTLGMSSSLPTVSSLDIDGDPLAPIPPPGSGATPFDDYTCSATNQRHLQLTSEVVDWLVNRVEHHQPAAAAHDMTSGAS
jgi:hypothetical protein